MGRSLSDAELRTMVADVDVDGSGEIDFDEFLIIMARDKKNSDPVDEAMKVAANNENCDKARKHRDAICR